MGTRRTMSGWIVKKRVQYGELNSLATGYGLLESPCECGIEPSASISNGVSQYTKVSIIYK